MIKKASLIETLDNLPDEFLIDDLLDRLLIIQKIEKAEEQSKAGEVYSEAEAKNLIKIWSK